MGRWLTKDELKERRQLVVQLHEQYGYSLYQISKRMDIEYASVWRDYYVHGKIQSQSLKGKERRK